MKSRVGFETVEFDPTKKYDKAAGFGGAGKAPKPHYEYVEDGRRPWLYRNGGASVVRFDDLMPYPRLCAHRGFNAVAPENSMPAFGAAVALGAGKHAWEIVDRAIAIGADKVQPVKWAYDPAMISKAHAHGIRVNFFWADDPAEALALFDAGINCVLTNDFLAVKNAIKNRK